MEPYKQDLKQRSQPRPEEKNRRFRLVKVEEQRFRMDKLEERIAPSLLTSSGKPGTTVFHCH